MGPRQALLGFGSQPIEEAGTERETPPLHHRRAVDRQTVYIEVFVARRADLTAGDRSQLDFHYHHVGITAFGEPGIAVTFHRL